MYTHHSAAPAPASIETALVDAWAQMKRILFAPFDIGKWFVLGFSAWLATLGESGCSSIGNYGGSNGGGGDEFPSADAVREFFTEYGVVILSVTAFIILIAVAIGMVLLWLRSRGTFMFLDNVVHDRAEIVEPWKRFRDLGNSLFLWQFVFGIASLFITLLILGAGVLIALPAIRAWSFGPSALTALVVIVPLLLLWTLAALVIVTLLKDFVAPIMYVHGTGTMAAWGLFLPLFRARFWSFVLYLLVQFGLGIGAGLAVLALVLLTCCCAGIFLIIPYVGTVLVLPIPVFFRAFSLCYLRQYGEEFDVYPRPPELPVAAE